ncbi:hypothetical protein MP638_000099 [Amoeboaphelidium occidentale]|nr:hypothetical protein MP638_000099 [Amoeboaphelidium occidentale]
MFHPPRLYTDARRDYDLVDLHDISQRIFDFGLYNHHSISSMISKMSDTAGTKQFYVDYMELHTIMEQKLDERLSSVFPNEATVSLKETKTISKNSPSSLSLFANVKQRTLRSHAAPLSRRHPYLYRPPKFDEPSSKANSFISDKSPYRSWSRRSRSSDTLSDSVTSLNFTSTAGSLGSSCASLVPKSPTESHENLKDLKLYRSFTFPSTAASDDHDELLESQVSQESIFTIIE